jgi:hypothetical protein
MRIDLQSRFETYFMKWFQTLRFVEVRNSSFSVGRLLTLFVSLTHIISDENVNISE